MQNPGRLISSCEDEALIKNHLLLNQAQGAGNVFVRQLLSNRMPQLTLDLERKNYVAFRSDLDTKISILLSRTIVELLRLLEGGMLSFT